MKLLSFCLAIVAVPCVCRPLRADFLTIYGAPPYDGTDSTNGTGYQSRSSGMFLINGSVFEGLGKLGPGIYP